MGHRQKGRIRLLRGLGFEVELEVGWWLERVGIGKWFRGVAAEMARRL